MPLTPSCPPSSWWAAISAKHQFGLGTPAWKQNNMIKTCLKCFFNQVSEQEERSSLTCLFCWSRYCWSQMWSAVTLSKIYRLQLCTSSSKSPPKKWEQRNLKLLNVNSTGILQENSLRIVETFPNKSSENTQHTKTERCAQRRQRWATCFPIIMMFFFLKWCHCFTPDAIRRTPSTIISPAHHRQKSPCVLFGQQSSCHAIFFQM